MKMRILAFVWCARAKHLRFRVKCAWNWNICQAQLAWSDGKTGFKISGARTYRVVRAASAAWYRKPVHPWYDMTKVV